jgi:hypothetical protein
MILKEKTRKVSPPWGKNKTLPPLGVVLDGVGHRQGLGHDLHITFITGFRGREIGGRCRGRGGRSARRVCVVALLSLGRIGSHRRGRKGREGDSEDEQNLRTGPGKLKHLRRCLPFGPRAGGMVAGRAGAMLMRRGGSRGGRRFK